MESGSVPWLVLGAVASAALGAIFTGADAALAVLPESRVQALAESDDRAFQRFLVHRRRITATWLAIRILCTSLTAAFVFQAGAVAFPRANGDPSVAPRVLARWGTWLPMLLALGAYGLLAEVMVGIGRRRPDRMGRFVLGPMRVFEWIASPLAWPFAVLGRLVESQVTPSASATPELTEKEVNWVVAEGQKTGTLGEEPASIIRNVLDFKDVTTRLVLVPRRRISAIEEQTPLGKVLELAATDGHSRYPVYRDSIDNIVGLLHVKDLFQVVREGRLESATLAELVRAPVLFVSESQKATSVLKEMRARRLHMAIVVDDFGGTSGVVTLEDLLEEIVGDIRDEYDTEVEAKISRTKDGHVVADADVSLVDLAAHLGRDLPSAPHFESLGGLIVHRAGRVPDVGTTLTLDEYTLRVLEADEKRVVRVEISKNGEESTAQEEAAPPVAAGE
jgi:CBS domain containing-hemolysin-like protein